MPDVSIRKVHIPSERSIELPPAVAPAPLSQMKLGEYVEARRIDYGINGGKPRVLGRTTPQACRFCLLTAPRVGFRKAAHLIPNSLGNNTWFTAAECDDCNQRFGLELEDHLAKFLAPMRSSWATPGKTETHSHSLRRGGSRIDADGSRRASFIVLEDGDDSITWEPNRASKSVRMSIKTQPVSMCRVGRSVGLMGLRAMPVHLMRLFEPFRVWVRGDANWPFLFPMVFLPGAYLGPSLSTFFDSRLWDIPQAWSCLPFTILLCAFTRRPVPE